MAVKMFVNEYENGNDGNLTNFKAELEIMAEHVSEVGVVCVGCVCIGGGRLPPPKYTSMLLLLLLIEVPWRGVSEERGFAHDFPGIA